MDDNSIISQGTSSNALIKQAEMQIEKQLPPNVKEDYMKIVVSGMRVAMNNGANSILASLKQSKDPVTDVVKGAIAIVGLMRKESKGEMPMNALVPAAMTLVLHGLDAAERLGSLKVGKEELDRATELFADTFLPLVGVTKDRLGKLTEKVHGAINDPAQLAQLRQAQASKDAAPVAPPTAAPAPPIGGQNAIIP